MAYAFFDLDQTLITAQSQSLLLKTLYRHKYLSWSEFARLRLFFILYKLHLTPKSYLNTIYDLAGHAMEGVEVAEVGKVVHDFVFQTFPSIENRVAVEALQKHISAGDDIVLSSSAFEPIVKAAAEYFHIDEYRASKLEIKDGKYTGEHDGKPNYGAQKLNSLLDFDFNNSYGYSDHQSDIPILEKTSHPVAVSPTGQMEKFAMAHSWPILK
ncbi:MAG: hypothetical protein RJB39_188 [Candidatus Parcubacteria bacterium]|jgi:HAD superfamily hydrolase (TIGR01490 family)